MSLRHAGALELGIAIIIHAMKMCALLEHKVCFYPGI